MNLRPSLCHFLGHDDAPPDLFGEVRCVHCWDLAPPWAHIGIRCGDGMVPLMNASWVFARQSEGIAQAFQGMTDAFARIQDAMVPVARTIQEALDTLTPQVLAAAAQVVANFDQ